MIEANVRLECLRPAEKWIRPSKEEIREVLRLADLTGTAAARKLGLGQGGDRTIRRWVGEVSPIPYTAWAVLCHLAGLGAIWEE